MTLGTALRLSNFQTIIIAIVLGFVFGFGFGLIPLLRSKYPFARAAGQVLVVEGLSIAVMEAVEVLVQVYTPGVLEAHLHEPIYWIGMGLSLLAGFGAAFPVNYLFVKRGIRHRH